MSDGCCNVETDCSLGGGCNAGFCLAQSPDIELGQGSPYVKIHDGGTMTVFEGFQGFGDLFLSYQTLGFTPSGNAINTLRVTRVDNGVDIIPEQAVPFKPFMEISPSVNQLLNDYWFIFANPLAFDGLECDVFLTITDQTNPSISVSIEQRVVLDVVPFNPPF